MKKVDRYEGERLTTYKRKKNLKSVIKRNHKVYISNLEKDG
jgi:hypothetical protein